MEPLNITTSTNLLMSVREITSEHLPISHSIIPYQIILVVMYHHIMNEELTVKQLFNSGPFSEMGNRYHYKRLVTDEWIVLINHPNDLRQKLIRPALKSIQAFHAISEKFNSTLPEILIGMKTSLPK
jgi:hypothetical protein